MEVWGHQSQARERDRSKVGSPVLKGLSCATRDIAKAWAQGAPGAEHEGTGE